MGDAFGDSFDALDSLVAAEPPKKKAPVAKEKTESDDKEDKEEKAGA